MLLLIPLMRRKRSKLFDRLWLLVSSDIIILLLFILEIKTGVEKNEKI